MRKREFEKTRAFANPVFRRDLKSSEKLKTSLKFACLFFALLFIVGEQARGQNADFYLKNGDRVVFYGDSITEQAFYTNLVETYVVTRFPNLNVSFTNSGWSGDKIWGGDGGSLDERLKRDVFPFKPTVLTAMFGMNDGCYVEFNADCFKVYQEYYAKFLTSVKTASPETRITLLQPSPYDDWTNSSAWRLAPSVKGGYNNVLIRFSGFVEKLANENKLTVAGMNAPLVDLIEKAQKSDAELAQKIIPDRIHPSAAGGLLMGKILLEKWNAPAIVSTFELNASNQKIIASEKTKISDLKIGKNLSWTQTDDALPFPIDMNDKTIALVVKLSDVVEKLDRQILKVANLNAAKYVLKIDDAEIGAFTKEELANGINLATLKTPMLKQALEIQKLTEEHNKIHFVRWREVQILFADEIPAETKKTLDSLDAMEAKIVKKQREKAQPKARKFELIPV